MKLFKLKALLPLSRLLRGAKAPTAPTGDEDRDTFFMILDGKPVTFAEFNDRMALHFAPEALPSSAERTCLTRRMDR